MEEDRSALFNQLKNFSQRKLKKVETKVVTASGEQLVEKRGAKGLQVLSGDGAGGKDGGSAEPARKLDLQVGLVLPGFLIGSQDVAHDKSSLEGYGVTHILNLASGEVENKFEDDYNYKNINIQDRPSFELDSVLEDCYDFIDDGRHYGNVLIHCAGTVGLSRSTTVCVAYLMSKEKQRLDEALTNVKEVRSFVKPSEGFMKQLKEYEVKLRGAQQAKESGIDDPFALRKKQEIEQEKAMVAGAASVKNRMKMFGQTLDAPATRSKSVSPAPQSASVANRWSAAGNSKANDTILSKSTTPEPRKGWRDSPSSQPAQDWRSNSSQKSAAPPPPPPMPSASLHGHDKSITTLNKASLPPPPPPPPPTDLMSSGKTSAKPPTTANDHGRNESQQQERKVFGRVPPPPMKLRSGISMERQDSSAKSTSNSPQAIDQQQFYGQSPVVLFNQVAAPNGDQPGSAPKRTTSLGPLRRVAKPQLGDSLRRNPFLQGGPFLHELERAEERRESFSKVAGELQTSLKELDKLIDDASAPPTPAVAAGRRQFSLKPPIVSAYLAAASAEPFTSTGARSRCASFNDPSLYLEVRQQLARPADDEEPPSCRAASVNDLRSLFEKPPLSPQAPARRPSSALKSGSQWLQRLEEPQPPLPPSAGASANSIRRTSSTNSRRTDNLSSSVRNPYRGFR